jgi:hypothetical protein
MGRERMEPNEYDALLGQIDHLIDRTDSRQREYYRGYREGIKLYRIGGRTIVNFCLNKYYKATGDPYLDAYSRGFMNGCRGVRLEDCIEPQPLSKASPRAGFALPKFMIFFKDTETDNDVAVGVLEERRRFERGDNITGLLKLAKKIFAIRTEGLSNIHALKISG